MSHKKSKLAVLLCPVVLSAFITGCGSTYHQESTGEYLDSSAITTKVKTKILADNIVGGLPITVNTYKSNVQLSGFVNTYAQKRRAENIAKSVKGVETVQDAIVIKPQ